VPLFDYDIPPEEPQRLDSSAAAIMAAGLLQLAGLTDDAATGRLYRETARHTLLTLSRPPFLAEEGDNWEGILKEGVYHLHKNLGVGESVMWGEYFFVEALDRALADD
jgi:unsaturated chondroitin disaccharide hydrolase